MARALPGSLYDRVRRAVADLGECTPRQILAVVGPTIPAALAARYAHKEIAVEQRRGRSAKTKHYRPHELIAKGRRRLVSCALDGLRRCGYVVRVAKGLYRPGRTPEYGARHTPGPRRVVGARAAPLTWKVLEFVRRHDECSVARVVAELGDLIPAAQGARRGRPHFVYAHKYKQGPPLDEVPQTALVARGRRQVIAETLCSLVKQGLLKRVRPAHYAPVPLPSPNDIPDPVGCSTTLSHKE